MEEAHPAQPKGNQITLTVSNLMSSRMDLVWVRTKNGDITAPVVQDGTRDFSNNNTADCTWSDEYVGGSHRYISARRRRQMIAAGTLTVENSSDPASDLGIVFVSGSVPPRIKSITKGQDNQNYRLKAGMELVSIGVSRHTHSDTNMFVGDSYSQIIDKIKAHKRPICLQFRTRETGEIQYVGSLGACQTNPYNKQTYVPPKVVLKVQAGAKLYAVTEDLTRFDADPKKQDLQQVHYTM